MDATMRKHTPTPEPSEFDPRWTALVARDRQADGTFCYSVQTTGVYLPPFLCLPSRESQERALPSDTCRRRAGRFPALPALQAG